MILAAEPLSADKLDTAAGFHLLFSRNPLPMWVFDSDSHLFLAVNEAAVQKYGWSREEFLEMTVDELRPAEDSRRILGEPAAQRDETSGLNTTAVCRHRLRDGRIIDVESTWHEIPFEGQIGVLVVTMDRSEQTRAEERAREQASLLDLASDAIIVRDLDHRVLFWNQGAERLYGWTAKEAVGSKATQLFKGDAEHFATAFKELFESGIWSAQLDQCRKDGREVIVSSRWTLVRDDDGRPKSVLVINTDISETKKLESQFLRAQRLESIGTMASGIAHDLNNILSPILMAVGILRRSLGEGDHDKLLNIVESSAERGAGIVKQVLTFARGVEGDRVLLQPKHLVTELAKIMSQTFPRNIDIQTRFPAELWTVTGDATQIHQVLLNLCVNARDAMPAGGSIVIGAENVEVDEHFASMNPGAQLGPHVVFRVTDTGSGISSETMDKIFDPFFTTKEVGKGTGLGLATVIGIVKSHGGFLTVQSQIGFGTTFRAFLPASPDAAAAAPTEALESAPLGQGELILVVDDEMPIRDALVRTLQTNGYEAYTAEDGTDALALYFQRRNEIALVLTDLAMGQMDGITLVRSLRKLNPQVKVIVSSGQITKENHAVLSGLGIPCLDKPYTADRLLRALRTTLTARV